MFPGSLEAGLALEAELFGRAAASAKARDLVDAFLARRRAAAPGNR
jgi:hypothetical protein